MRLNRCQHAVDEREILGDRQGRRDLHKQRLQKEKECCQRKTGERPDNRNQEFGAGARGFAGDLGDAAKDEEGDPVHGNFVAKGHPRMGQLVNQDAGEKQHRGHGAHQPVFALVPPLNSAG